MDVNIEEVREARALLVRAVEEKGADYVYEPPAYVHLWDFDNDTVRVVSVDHPEADSSCVYAAPKSPEDETLVPCCIVGHVAYYRSGADGLVSAHGHEGSNPSDLDLFRDMATVHALTEAQRQQDQGKTWGEALEAFDQSIAESCGDEILAEVKA